jgi:ATP-binding cassette, subfamily B, bacterial MsbA
MLTFYMLVPMLDIIFNQYHAQVIEKPAFELTKEYGNKLVLYYYAQIQQSGFLGKIGPLIVVCLVILASNLLSNFFKYFAMRILLVTKKIITQGV